MLFVVTLDWVITWIITSADNWADKGILGLAKWRGTGGSPREQGAGGVREIGEERAGGGISTMAGSGREIQKGKLLLFVTAYFQSKKRPQERFLTSI